MIAFEVFLGTKMIDTVYFPNGVSKEEAYANLVDVEGYDVGIILSDPLEAE